MDQSEAYLWKQRAQVGADRIKDLERLLSRAYPLLHNPYTQQTDPHLATVYATIIRDVEIAIQHVPDETPDPEDQPVALPCASCDGEGRIITYAYGQEEYTICPNCAPISVLD